jgi:hypothetical protein
MLVFKADTSVLRRRIIEVKSRLMHNLVQTLSTSDCNTFAANCCPGCCPDPCTVAKQKCCNDDGSFTGTMPSTITVTLTPDSPYCTAFGGSITLNRDPGQDCNSIWIVFNGDATLGTCNFHVTAAITPCQFVYLDIGIYDDHMNLQDCGLWYLTNQAHWNPSLYTFPYTYSCPFTSGTGRIDFDDHQDNCYCIHDNPEERNTRRHCYCIVTVSA